MPVRSCEAYDATFALVHFTGTSDVVQFLTQILISLYFSHNLLHGSMEQGVVKKLLAAQVDDGEEGQTNGVLQHYAYR